MTTLYSACQLCFLFSAFGAAQQVAPEKILVIENISVIDAVSAAAQPNKTVVIVGNRIKAIGETGRVTIPAKAKIIKGAGNI